VPARSHRCRLQNDAERFKHARLAISQSATPPLISGMPTGSAVMTPGAPVSCAYSWKDEPAGRALASCRCQGDCPIRSVIELASERPASGPSRLRRSLGEAGRPYLRRKSGLGAACRSVPRAWARRSSDGSLPDHGRADQHRRARPWRHRRHETEALARRMPGKGNAALPGRMTSGWSTRDRD
jgi:hypothetical protein